MPEPSQNPWGLTARESEVLGLLKEIGHAKGVAEALGISPRTVEEHLANIRRKMAVDTTMLSVLEYHAWLDRQSAPVLKGLELKEGVPKRVPAIAILAFCLPVVAIVAIMLNANLSTSKVKDAEKSNSLVDASFAERSDVLVSIRTNDSEDRDIALIDLESKEIQPITNSQAEDLESVWSPDGTKIAFTSNRTGDYDIWTMNSDGSKLKNITNQAGEQRFPSWHPDGKSIVYQSMRKDNPNGDIFSCDLDSLESKAVSNAAGDDCQPSFSPSGKAIAFSSNRNGRYEIFVFDVSSKVTKQVSRIGGDCYSPNWSQDGKSLVFSSNADGNWEIYMVGVSNSTSRRLTNRINAPDGSPTFNGMKVVWDSTEDGQSYLYEGETDGTNAKRVFWETRRSNVSSKVATYPRK